MHNIILRAHIAILFGVNVFYICYSGTLFGVILWYKSRNFDFFTKTAFSQIII